MRTLSLEINQDDLYEFFQLYRPLTDLQKKIWQLLIWWCKKYPCANPKQTTIAKKAGCSRKHVNKTLKIFQGYGWLALFSRGNRQPKILNIPDNLLQIDLFKNKYFKRVEVTAEVTHSYSSGEYFTSKAGEIAKQPKKEIEIPREAIEMNFSKTNSLKLGLVSPSALQQALEKCKEMGKDGWRPEKPQEYIVGIALNIAKSRNEKLDWPSYYQQIGMDTRNSSANWRSNA